jgi:uncharacterized protein
MYTMYKESEPTMSLRIALLSTALLLPLATSAQTPTPPAATASIDSSTLVGAWAGTLDLGTAKLHIIFHISSSPTGLSATLDSPDQGATGIPTTSTTLTGRTLTISAEALHGNFTGTVDPEHPTITGTWTQGPNTLPLVLTKQP